jgi:methyltransferase
MVSRLLYSLLLAALGLERLFELWLSRRNAERAFAQGAVEAGQGHFGVMKVMHTLFLFSCAAEVWLLNRTFPGAIGWIALTMALGAQGLRYWAIVTLGERWNTRVIVWPSVPPVTGGPYRFVRHPNYTAVIVEMVSVPVIHGAYLTAVGFSLANAWLLRIRIRAEEKALGETWSSAFKNAPRFIPAAQRPAHRGGNRG